MSLPKTFPISFNPGIIDKPAERTGVPWARGWRPVDATEDGVIDAVRRGWAIAPQYQHGRRRTANFIRAGFVAADIDSGITLDDALQSPFVKQWASFIYTSPSHRADHHRFRIVFLLEEHVLSADDWAAVQLGLALLLGTDPSVSDGGRLFFGYRLAEIFRMSRTMPAHVVADLLQRGRDAQAAGRPLGGKLLPLNSARRIAGPELIRLSTAEQMRMDELRPGLRVHCPNHDDADPSAFTVASSKGSDVGIHCMACKATFWPNGERDDYDFDAFDRLFEALRAGSLQPNPDAPGLDKFFPIDPKFERLQERFLPAIAYEPGVTLVKSPKGSGKTEALKRLIEHLLAGIIRSDIKQRDVPMSVLLIGHRRTLVSEAAKKIGLRCYLDEGQPRDGQLRTLAVCLDSLPKYSEARSDRVEKFEGPYDLVIIDESEQVLSHLVGETVKSRFGIDRCFDALKFHVSQAKAVIALDADLGMITAHALKTLRPQDWEGRCRILCNEPVVPEERRTMRLFKDRKRLEREVVDAVRGGQRCFIVSNSKNCVKALQKMIENECGSDIVLRVVTSDNSRDDSTRAFLDDIKTRILAVRVLVASPSIGTGIDITFPDDACMVDRVFGFFYPFINTHTDIDQQLARVRNPGAIDVWISPHRFSFTSNAEVIMDDLARAYTVKRAVLGTGEDGMVKYNREDALLLICAHVTAQQRASKNRLLELFCSLREKNGWSVARFDEEGLGSPLNVAKRELQDQRIVALRDAPTIADDAFIELDDKKTKGAVLSPEELILHEKKHFEWEVGLPLDPELVEHNKDGRLVDRVDLLSQIVQTWSLSSEEDFFGSLLPNPNQPEARLQSVKAGWLVGVLMRSAGLIQGNGFATSAVISSTDLDRFAALCRENRTMIEEATGQQIRRDLEKKPVQHLNLFVRLIGLRFRLIDVKKVKGQKVRYYQLDGALAERMAELARSRLKVKAKREDEKEKQRKEERKKKSATLW